MNQRNSDELTHAETKPGDALDDVSGRFWSKVDRREPDDCWEWTAAVHGSGYGAFSFDGRWRGGIAHRVAFYLSTGDDRVMPPAAATVTNTCGNRLCCNPDHLRLAPAKRGRPSTDWSKVEHMFGVEFDDVIADAVGRDRSTVTHERNRRGISPRKWLVLPETVEGFGIDRDEVVAERGGMSPELVKERRKQLGIKRPRGLAAQRSRMARVEADPASATAEDVQVLVDKIEELRRSIDSTRKARNSVRLAGEVQALRCLAWVLMCEEDVDDAPERVQEAHAHVASRMAEQCEAYWERAAERGGHGRGWVEQNVKFDPARAEFIEYVLKRGVA